jgi:predicted nucleic-acid-binding Zn-ribbon protein
MPCIAVLCTNCGYMEFYNVHVLGIAGALGVPNPGVPIG